MVALMVLGLVWLTVMTVVGCKVILPDMIGTIRFRKEMKKIKKSLGKAPKV